MLVQRSWPLRVPARNHRAASALPSAERIRDQHQRNPAVLAKKAEDGTLAQQHP